LSRVCGRLPLSCLVCLVGWSFTLGGDGHLFQLHQFFFLDSPPMSQTQTYMYSLYLSLYLLFIIKNTFEQSFSVEKLKRVSYPIGPKCLGDNGPSSVGEGSTRSGAGVGSRLPGAGKVSIWCSLSEISAACSKFGLGMQVEDKLLHTRAMCKTDR